MTQSMMRINASVYCILLPDIGGIVVIVLFVSVCDIHQSLGHLLPDAFSNHWPASSSHHSAYLDRCPDNDDPLAALLSFSERLSDKSGNSSLFRRMAEWERQGPLFHIGKCRLLLLATTHSHLAVLRHDMDPSLETIHPHRKQRCTHRSTTATIQGSSFWIFPII